MIRAYRPVKPSAPLTVSQASDRVVSLLQSVKPGVDVGRVRLLFLATNDDCGQLSPAEWLPRMSAFINRYLRQEDFTQP